MVAPAAATEPEVVIVPAAVSEEASVVAPVASQAPVASPWRGCARGQARGRSAHWPGFANGQAARPGGDDRPPGTAEPPRAPGPGEGRPSIDQEVMADRSGRLTWGPSSHGLAPSVRLESHDPAAARGTAGKVTPIAEVRTVERPCRNGDRELPRVGRPCHNQGGSGNRNGARTAGVARSRDLLSLVPESVPKRSQWLSGESLPAVMVRQSDDWTIGDCWMTVVW